jgi:DNA-binding GntR family transcriptional regulator
MLERDGLVKQSGKRGVVVANITREEADELYLVHGHLIGLAAKLSCRRMKGDALNTMAELVDKLRRCAAQEDRHGSLETRAELEQLICERSFSPRLAHLFEIMAYPSARYRVFHVSVPGYMEKVVRCYEGVCAAFARVDASACLVFERNAVERSGAELRERERSLLGFGPDRHELSRCSATWSKS